MQERERSRNDLKKVDSQGIFLKLGEDSELVLSDAQISELISLGIISITYDAAQSMPESGVSGIVVELTTGHLPPIKMMGKFLEGRTDAVSFEYAEPKHAEVLGTWIHEGKPEPTTRVDEGLEYTVTPVTQKIVRSLNGYVWRNHQNLIKAAAQQQNLT